MGILKSVLGAFGLLLLCSGQGASAANRISLTGFFIAPDHANLAGRLDVSFNFYYDLGKVDTVYSYDSFCFCNEKYQYADLQAVSGRIGDTIIPYTRTTGQLAAYFGDGENIRAFYELDGLPYVVGAVGLWNPELVNYPQSGQQSFVSNLSVQFPDGSSFSLTRDNAYVAIGTAVPEPATWLMLLAGFGALGGVLRTGRRARPVSRSVKPA